MLQNELLLASEAEKTSQRADLEDHIKTAQNSLEEKKEEISKLQKQQEQSENWLNMYGSPILTLTVSREVFSHLQTRI